MHLPPLKSVDQSKSLIVQLQEAVTSYKYGRDFTNRPRTMRVFSAFVALVIAKVGLSLDTSSSSTSSPVVALPYGSFRGEVVGTTAQFLGMPFAAPPYVIDPLFSIMQFHNPLPT